MKHVELIIDYLIDGEDFQYFDNTGTIVRCKDCINNKRNVDGVTEDWCMHFGYDIDEDDYCSYGER